MNKDIKVGIIGAGGVTIFHYRGYAASGVEIKAIADTDKQALARRQREWGIPDGYADYRDLLADPDIAAVSVCLPNALHHTATFDAAKAGKHILCEKPISLALTQAQDMIRACREAGVILQIGHHLRSGSEAMKARELIDAGALGRIAYVRLRQAHDWAGAQTVRDSFAKVVNSGGGTLLDNGCHLMDLARFFAGEVNSVYAQTGTHRFAIEVEDSAVVSLEFDSGAFGTVETSWTSAGWENAFSIYGTEGVVEYTNRVRPAVLRHYHRTSPGTTWEKTDVSVHEFAGLDAHSRSVVDFLDAVRGNRDVVCTGDDGLAALQLVLASYESAATRAPVELRTFSPTEPVAEIAARAAPS